MSVLQLFVILGDDSTLQARVYSRSSLNFGKDGTDIVMRLLC